MIASLLIPLLLQVGPNPASGGIPDYSAEIQDRPPRDGTRAQQDRAAAQWLDHCYELVESDPARAHVQAQVRRDATSGTERVLANHCLGLAATRLELWSDAHAAFAAAHDETPAEEGALRARFGAMAGNAALADGKTETALDELRRARAEARAAGSGDLVALTGADEARILVPLGRIEEAGALLAEARALRPEDSEIRLLSATLLRRQNRLGEAQQEIEAAARLAPGDPATGLEAGVIAMLDGREDAARKSWQSVIESAPDSAEASTARAYLAQTAPGTAQR